MEKEIHIPELCLVVLVGASSSGKSTFARKHFLPSEVLSSDSCRAWVSNDENDMSATQDAFDLLHYMAGIRLKRGLLTVVDATNVQHSARKPLLALARTHHVLPVVIAFDIDPKICQERSEQRPDRDFGPHVIRNHTRELRQSLRSLKKEGFRVIHTLNSPEEVDAVSLKRDKLWNDRKDDSGPFDIIGDVHGCFDELHTLLTDLGYQIRETGSRADHYGFEVTPPEGRRAFFVGDLVDRGPRTPDCLAIAMSMVENGQALCVPGNHEVKLLKALDGRNVQVRHGLAESLEQLAKEPPEFVEAAREFMRGLISHLVLDGGKLVVAHAGLKESMQGRSSGAVRSFCLYGETTGETDEFGLPVRYNWALEYEGRAMVVYGHTPVPEARWLNKTIDIDTGCVFGGKLTAIRYPELSLHEVKARKVYCEPAKPLETPQEAAPEADLPEVTTLLKRNHVETRYAQRITIREENAAAALEVMSRFAVEPHWLIYLPPTMSPSATSQKEGYLEYPEEAFAYYRKEGVTRVICEEKHMGSRAVVIVSRNAEAAVARFGVRDGKSGVCYTRTGRGFFTDDALEAEFIAEVNRSLEASEFYDRFQTDWVALDCELMPWSAKAQSLIRDQYAATGAAAEAVLGRSAEMMQMAQNRLPEAAEFRDRLGEKQNLVTRYREAYRHYCWPVSSLADYKLAPFHILATEGRTYEKESHTWHMEEIARFAGEGLMMATPYRVVDLTDEGQCRTAMEWWEELTAKGGEGMVVKPLDFTLLDNQGRLIQPALKCRGPEYLRIIYGPEYSLPENLDRLRERGLNRKRSMAVREYALGWEALSRFVLRENFRRVHECVFGVLALESEPVDPRL